MSVGPAIKTAILQKITCLGKGSYSIDLLDIDRNIISIICDCVSNDFSVSTFKLFNGGVFIGCLDEGNIYFALKYFHESVNYFRGEKINDRKVLNSIEYISDTSYCLELFSRSCEVVETLCEVTVQGGIKIFNFESDVFNKEVFLGFIYTKPVCRAISFFQDAATLLKPL